MPPTDEILSMIRSYNSIMLLMLNMYNRRHPTHSPRSFLESLLQGRNIFEEGTEDRRGEDRRGDIRGGEDRRGDRRGEDRTEDRRGEDSTEDRRRTGTDEEEVVMSFLFDIPQTQALTPLLTQRQILENTRLFVYSTETSRLTQTTCPISHLEFENGDILCEIKHCHHVFRYGEIMRWLGIDRTCPVCRSPVQPSITV